MLWEPVLKKAIKQSEFVLVCLSATSINKRGFLQREIKQALEHAEEKLEDDVYLIPARLDDCEVPDALSEIQWVNLFEEDGWRLLLKAMEYGLQLHGKTLPVQPKIEPVPPSSAKEPIVRQQDESTTKLITRRPDESPTEPIVERVGVDERRVNCEGSRQAPQALSSRRLLIAGAALAAVIMVAFLLWLDPLTPATPMNLTGASFVRMSFTTAQVNAQGQIVDQRQEQCQGYVEDLGNGVKLEMVEIPRGTFAMGSSDSDVEEAIAEWLKFTPEEEKSSVPGWVRAESPQHRVTVTGFFMGKYEVTQKQWLAVMSANPSRFRGDDLPVEQVLWEEAVEFCKRLSQKTGKRYRLPTEAEWEYAARAGTTTPFHFGETITRDVANFDYTRPWKSPHTGPMRVDRGQTTTVGSTGFANAFGLYDIHGNVWEWCQDLYDSGYYRNSPATDPQGPSSGLTRVIRGGGWVNAAADCRSVFRFHDSPGVRRGHLGFRLVMQP